MTRFVSPPVSEFHKLRQPLERGEKLVFEFFDKHLPLEWEIYVQPHMNGLRPDFVLLHPGVGIAIYEVKDWDLDAMDYRVEDRAPKAPVLLVSKNGRTFSKQKDNPIEKVFRYKNELFNLYCPRLEQRAGFAVITAGVIFPSADDRRVKTLFSLSVAHRGMDKYPQYNPLVGRNTLLSGDILAVLPASKWGSSKYMNETLAADIRHWLIEPDFSVTQREPLKLDDKQKSYVKSRTASGYRRIRGAAGSGKSLVLAARAAELLGEGKQVLVVTFNITLVHYLMDIAVRWPQSGGRTRSDITWLNFHAWCKRVCFDCDCETEYDSLWKDNNDVNHVLDIELPYLTNQVIDEDHDNLVTRYDAILVDEGQDFLPSWWAVLRRACKPDGEMLLVADATQDIYEKARSWTDEAMTGAGFRGAWSELDISHRLPALALDQASRFAQMYLPPDMVNLPKNDQIGFALEPCELRWVQAHEDVAVNVCCNEILRLFGESQFQNLAITDSTFLCGSKGFGLQVVSALDNKGVKAIHTYHLDERESRRQKVGFYMGDARVKATTLHSFKGWESRILVLYVGGTLDDKSYALLYTGLTRLKRHLRGSCLTVVSSSPQLLEYGKAWPSFEVVGARVSQEEIVL